MQPLKGNFNQDELDELSFKISNLELRDYLNDLTDEEKEELKKLRKQLDDTLGR